MKNRRMRFPLLFLALSAAASIASSPAMMVAADAPPDPQQQSGLLGRQYIMERVLKGEDKPAKGEQAAAIVTDPPAPLTDAPTASPSISPKPTTTPTKSPSASPTQAPSMGPTESPSKAPTNSPTASPSKAPTGSPTSSSAPSNTPTDTHVPSSSPSFTPGTVERFFCVKVDEAPLGEEYCDGEEYDEDEYYTSFEECDDDCDGGNHGCYRRLCVTDHPTLSPTGSVSPSAIPTSVSSSVPSASSTPTESPTASPVTPIPFSFLGPEDTVNATRNSTDSIMAGAATAIEAIPMSAFVLQLAVGGSNDGGRRGRQLLRGDRNMQEGEDLFQAAQDDEILYLVSDHLLAQLDENLEGEPIAVELEIDEKSERFARSGELVVTYRYVGNAVYAAGDDPSALPTTADLDREVLKAFNTPEGKRAFKNALEYSDDPILDEVVNMRATSASTPVVVEGSDLDPNQAKENENVGAVDGGASDDSSDENALSVGYIVLIAVAIFVTLSAIGFLAYRKYQKYQQNNANNDYINYQNKKKRKKDGKKAKKYDNFESQEGSEVSQSEDPINDLEIVGGETYPMSQDNSDADTASPAKQFDPETADTMPFDESPTEESPTAAAYDMTYFARSANQMMDQSSSPVDEETLKGLYSDSDSYFQSTVTPSETGAQDQTLNSIHSMDTLDNTFGFDGNESNVSHLLDLKKDGVISADELDSFLGLVDRSIADEPKAEEEEKEEEDEEDKIEEVAKNNAAAVSPEEVKDDSFDVSTASKFAEISMHIGDVMAEDSNNCSREEKPDVEDDHTDDNPGEEPNSEDVTQMRMTSLLDDDLSPKATASTPNTSDISTTDELYARIAELENKIINTESELAQDDNAKPVPPSESISQPLPSPNAEEGGAVALKALSDDTLGIIEESRLKGTPPPSVTTEVVKEAKENTLLGKFLNEESEEEDDVFE